MAAESCVVAPAAAALAPGPSVPILGAPLAAGTQPGDARLVLCAVARGVVARGGAGITVLVDGVGALPLAPRRRLATHAVRIGAALD